MKLSSFVRIFLVAAVSVMALAVVLVGVTALRTSSAPASNLAPTINVGLSPAKTVPATSGSGHNFGTLPPSHDNDAGGSRVRDQIPDADIDSYQRVH